MRGYEGTDMVRDRLLRLRELLRELPPLSAPEDPLFMPRVLPLRAGEGWHFAIVAADTSSFPFRCRAARTRSTLTLNEPGIWATYRIAAFMDNDTGAMRVGLVEDTEAPGRIYLLPEERKPEVGNVLH